VEDALSLNGLKKTPIACLKTLQGGDIRTLLDQIWSDFILNYFLAISGTCELLLVPAMARSKYQLLVGTCEMCTSAAITISALPQPSRRQSVVPVSVVGQMLLAYDQGKMYVYEGSMRQRNASTPFMYMTCKQQHGQSTSTPAISAMHCTVQYCNVGRQLGSRSRSRRKEALKQGCKVDDALLTAPSNARIEI